MSELLYTKCAICNNFENYTVVYEEHLSGDAFSVEVFSARRLPDRNFYQWVRCNKCGLLRSNPVRNIDTEKLYIQSTFDYSSEVDALKRTYSRLIRKNNLVAKNGFVLEIGGGNGFFLEECLSLGFNEICGVEPSIDAIEKADSSVKPFMIQNIMKNGVTKKNHFDLAVMFHTMDHLPAPEETIRAIYETLKNGGAILVAVHNEKSLSAKILKWRSPIIDIEHTYLFNLNSGKLMLESAGFREVKSGTYWNKYSLKYLLHLVPISVSIKNRILNSKIGNILEKMKVYVPLGNMWVVGIKS